MQRSLLVQFSRATGRVAMPRRPPPPESRKPRGPNKFRKHETVRLCQAVMAAGFTIARVEHDPATGRIVVVPGKPSDVSSSGNPWDEVLDAPKQKRSA